MPHHVLGRKRWAYMHSNWDISQWGRVAFSDESMCTIKPSTLRKRVWQNQVEIFNGSNLIPRFKSSYQPFLFGLHFR